MTNSGLTNESRIGVLISISEGIATISLNNPTKRNALTPQLADELVAAIDEVDRNASVGALIVKGEGGSFCSGADLGSLSAYQEDPAGEESYRALDRIYRAFTRLGEVGVPSIAAIRGSAVGAGVNLAFAADVRVVADNARIISGFVKIGVHPGGGHFQLLAQASSREVAAAMGVLSQEIDGRRAFELGLAWASVADTEVEHHARELALQSGKDPDLSRKAIQSLRITTPQVVPWAAALQAERAPQLWSFRRAANRLDSK